MKMNVRILLAAAVAGAMLSGCASIESVKRAQSTADQAVTLAKQGNAAALNAQATANGAQTAADAADTKADAAGTAATSAQKTIDDHLARQRRYYRKSK